MVFRSIQNRSGGRKTTPGCVYFGGCAKFFYDAALPSLRWCKEGNSASRQFIHTFYDRAYRSLSPPDLDGALDEADEFFTVAVLVHAAAVLGGGENPIERG